MIFNKIWILNKNTIILFFITKKNEKYFLKFRLKKLQEIY